MTATPSTRVGVPLRKATRADVARLADTLARAFHDDPVVGAWFAPDPSRRPEVLARFFQHQIVHVSLPLDEVWTGADLAGAALWAPPGRWRLPPLVLLRLLPGLTRAFGRRLPLLLRGLIMIEKHHPREPHYHLAYMGVAPERQGEGIGSALLAEVLHRCDREGVGAYLEATSERNRGLYERHGFEVRGELTCPKGPPLWPMWRDPQA